MSGNRQFVDTNVLVYAHDVTAGDKHSRARALVEELWKAREGCLSVQVLQEFFVTMTRKIPKPLDAPAAARIIGDLAYWHVHAPAANDVLAAIEIHQRTGASFWDAMILRSAEELGCGTLHSEDLNPGQAYAGVRVSNPFLTEPPRIVSVSCMDLGSERVHASADRAGLCANRPSERKTRNQRAAAGLTSAAGKASGAGRSLWPFGSAFPCTGGAGPAAAGVRLGGRAA